MMLITEEYRALNKDLHATRPDYGTSGAKWAGMVAEIAKWLDAATILVTANTRESPKAAMLGVFGAVGIALGIALALLLAVVAPASAQSVCATHAWVAKLLESRYAEAPIAIGLASNGGVIELFSTRDGSTWTLVMTMPDGKSCPVAAGQGWESLSSVALGPKA